MYRNESFNNTIQFYELSITPHYKNYPMINTSIKYIIQEKPPISFVSDVSEFIYLTGYSELNNEIVYTCNYYDKFVFESLIYDCNILFNVTNTLNDISSTRRFENAYSNNEANCNIALFGDYRNTTYYIYIDAYYEGYEAYKIRYKYSVTEAYLEPPAFKNNVVTNYISYKDTFTLNVETLLKDSYIYPYVDKLKYSINGVESIEFMHIYDNTISNQEYTVIASNIEFNHSNTLVLNVSNYVSENEEDTEPLVWT
jgi:hypothetical protein